MKRLLALFSVIGLSGFALATVIQQPIPNGPTVLTAAQVLASTPTYMNQVIICSNCGQANGGFGIICESTETANANNAYIILASSLTAVTACK